MIHARPDYQRFQDPNGKIPEDEPVFLLRGQDKVAAATVRIWAVLHRLSGGGEQIARLASHHADLMEQWPKKKLADLP